MKRLTTLICPVVVVILVTSLLAGCPDNTPLKYTTIHEAAAKGDLNDVKRHLRRGSAVNERLGWSDATPLLAAAEEGHIEVANFLIKNGADMNAAIWTGSVYYTPLYAAAEKGHLEMVRLLIKKGTDINKYGVYAIDTALKRDHAAIVILIAQNANVKAKDEGDNTFLYKVARSGYVEVAEILIKRGADVNARNRRGETPLHEAAYSGQTQVAELLIKRGANVNAKDKHGDTPLHRTLLSGGYTNYPRDITIVKALVKNGADVNAKNGYSKMPLHMAIQQNGLPETEVVNLLIENGADVNARDKDGSSPLHDVAWKCDTSTAELLIKNGADINAKTKGGRTPLDMVHDRKSGMAELFRQHGAKE